MSEEHFYREMFEIYSSAFEGGRSKDTWRLETTALMEQFIEENGGEYAKRAISLIVEMREDLA